MSCLPVPATFRLLDSLVGWDPGGAEGISGLDLASGLQLAFVGGAGGIGPADEVSACGRMGVHHVSPRRSRAPWRS